MPRIEGKHTAASTVVGWQAQDIRRNVPFPSFRPRHTTGDMFSQIIGRHSYRKDLDLAQIYTQLSRREYHECIQKALTGIKQERTVQVRWRLSKELPSFSPDFLYLYLSRYGEVEAIYQVSVNCCLVTFANEQTLRVVVNNAHLGVPYGRLYVKLWNPKPQDNDFFRVVKHLEEASSTCRRFHAMMDTDDRKAFRGSLRHVCRLLSDNNRRHGPSIIPYLCGELKDWKKPVFGHKCWIRK
ncbi:uncharacterized protein LOC101846064 [Aplysia californica]|uniref:Uncharacterized protein LOC101846064 n=1 Tax=Aplysia californica TaxID=6500 RepID=A0ABM0ZWP2_APLCA|nr:uncharacterized protein LOC101846064 [Aplysia californica]